MAVYGMVQQSAIVVEGFDTAGEAYAKSSYRIYIRRASLNGYAIEIDAGRFEGYRSGTLIDIKLPETLQVRWVRLILSCAAGP